MSPGISWISQIVPESETESPSSPDAPDLHFHLFSLSFIQTAPLAVEPRLPHLNVLEMETSGQTQLNEDRLDVLGRRPLTPIVPSLP